MLTRIQLENFKSWRELDLELAPLTLLFGTNSSGKTAILQSLLLLKQTANSFDRKQHINFGGGERDYVDFGSWRDLVYGHDEKNQVGIKIRWLPSDSSARNFVSFQIRWQYRNNSVSIHDLAYQAQDLVSVQASYINNEEDEEDEYLYEISTPTENKITPNTSPENGYRLPIILVIDKAETTFSAEMFFMNEFNALFEYFIDDINYLGPIRQHPQRTYLWTGSMPQSIEPNGENTVAALLASERKGEWTSPFTENLVTKVSGWLTKMGLVDEFRIEAIDRDKRFYETQVKIGNTASSLLDVGFGVSQVLPVITLLFFAPEGSIILLEQPELHLHPNAQAVLADLLLEVAEKRRLQLIVESHSEHLLRRLQRRVAETENAFANPDNIKMYFCQIKDGESRAEEVVVDQYGQIKNWPENFFGDITGDLEAMTRAALHKVMNGGERR